MNKKEDEGLSKPTSIRQSNSVRREPYTYTPSWMSPKERSMLKARVMKIKKREEMWGTKKEEGVLVQKSREKSPHPSQQFQSDEARKSEDMMNTNDIISEHDDNASSIGHHPSAISHEPSLTTPQTSTPKKDNKKIHKKSKGSTESLSKKKSKDELKMAKKEKEKHPKAVHSNPSGNLVEAQHPWIPHPRDTIEAHLWATDYRHFDPQLYAFKTPEKLSTKKPVMAECPPFWVLNDHTIAVAWKLYCKDADRYDLGIVALQWSREFVSAMKDERGGYPNAIKHLLDAIEDGLIFRYSRAAEDSKKAHEKDDDISDASSDSVFKQPTEVSYTLKDILSRNFPGRKFGDDHDGSNIRKDDTHAMAVDKSSLLPLSVLGDGESVLQQKDLIALLKQCKIEQEARIIHEMNASKEIDRLLKQALDGKLPIKIEKKDHVGFDMPDVSEMNVGSSKPKKLKKDADDIKKTTSTTSDKSTKSGASVKSAASSKSAKSSGSRDFPDLIPSANSELSTSSRVSTESNASKRSKTKSKKKSKGDLAKKQSKGSVTSEGGQKGGKKKSEDSLAKKKSKDSTLSNESKGSTSSKRKGSKGSKKKNKDSISSNESKGSTSSKRKESKGGKKGSKGSK